MTLIELTHLYATLLITAICWFVQIVHYPLFLEVLLINLLTMNVKTLLLYILLFLINGYRIVF